MEAASFTPVGGLPTAVARILDATGAAVGAGFLVAEDVVVTCAHVVAAAGTGPGGTLRLAFPHASGAPGVRGRVLSEPWRDPAAEDVAVIRLTEGPTGVAPLPLGSADGCQGHRVRSFGFPAQAPPGGHHGYGSVGDLLPSGGGSGADGGLLLQLVEANDLTTGFSGAPVVDEQTGRVIGMLTAITTPDSHLKGLGIAYATPTQVLRDVWPELAVQDDVCPYQGLEPFTTEHAAWFHGRQAAVERVVSALAGQRRAVLLLGPSGAGKSSLVQAGLLPALAEGRLPGSDRWLPVVVRPDHDLLAAIERAGLPGATDDGIAEAARRRLAADPDHERLLLVIDQSEELLTHTADGEALADRHLAALRRITAAVTSPGPLSVLLVMRDDFYPRLAALAPELLEAAAPGLVNMPATLGTSDLHAMITLPAQAVGLRFEEGLAQRIVADILAAGPDGAAQRAPVTALPLLELTLSQLWRRRRRADGYLTHDAYQALGRVTGSLTTWCDNAVQTLPAELWPTAQRILTALVRPADEAHDIPAVRQQVPVATLRELAVDTMADASADEQLRRADDVLAALTGHRIVTTRAVRPAGDSADDHGRPVAELIHDALIREWGTLRAWAAKDRQFQEWLRRAREQHELWTRSRRQGDLLDGTDLTEGMSWSAQRGLPGDIATFLGVSRAAEAKRRRVRRIGVALLTVLALIASGAAAFAFTERSAAEAHRRSALARTLAAESQSMLESQPGLAKQLAITAYRLDPTVGTAAMLSALGGPGVFDSADSVLDLAETHDGRTLLMSTGTSIAVWSTSEGENISRITGVTAGPLAVSPDGRVLAAGVTNGGHGSVRLWSLADPAHPAPLGSLPTSAARIAAVAISADGRLLAAAGQDGTIRLWDVAAPAHARQLPSLTGHRGGVDSLAFSPSRRLLASSGADHKVRLWDLAAPSRGSSAVATLDGFHPKSDSWTTYLPVVHEIAFTPDGTVLAAPGNGDNIALRLWGVKVPSKPRLLAAPDAQNSGTGDGDACAKNLRSIAFDGGGKVFAAVCADGSDQGSLTLWQAHDMQHVVPVHALPGVKGRLNGPVLFRPRSNVLLHATGNGVQEWDVGNPYQPGANGSYGQVPDGFGADAVISGGRRRLLATVGGDSGQLIDFTGFKGHHVVADLPGGYIGASAVAFSPDGTVLADSEHIDTGHGGRTLVLRLRSTSAAGAPVLATVDSIDQGVQSISFSGDGRIMAIADNNDDRNPHYQAGPSVKLFDVRDPRHPRQIARLPAGAFHVALSPDGRLLTANTADSLLSWDVSDPRHPHPRPALRLTPGSDVSVSAFRPDGKLIAAGDSSGTIRLFEVDGDRISDEPRSVIHSSSYSGSRPSFSPDGRTLAFVNQGDSSTNPVGPSDERAHVALWDVGDPQSPLQLGGMAYQSSSAITGTAAFSPTGPFLVTTISGAVDLWNTSPKTTIWTLCRTVGDVLQKEWKRYVPNERYEPPCEQPNVPDPAVILPTGAQGGG